MKNNVLLICLALVLASCQSTAVLLPTSTPITPTPPNTPTPTFTPTLPTSTSTPSPSPESTLSSDTNKKHDYLVYVASVWGPPTPSKPQLILYDLSNNKTQILSTNVVYNNFSLSKDNRLAFEKDDNIYVWDYPFAENTSTEIIFHGSPTTQKAVLSWGLEGRYLLLTGVQKGRNKLFLWDGKNVLDIYNYQGVIYNATWSNNGSLAFTENPIYYDVYNAPRVSDFGEIFTWDGKDIVNVSQIPSTSPTWSKDGQLAFLSYQNGEYTISVWDGKSKNNGAPDIKTLATPDLELSVNSKPTWTNSGSIVFIGSGKTDGPNQIYEWDGQTTRNISQTPSIGFYGLAWRNDRYWSAVTYQDSSPHYAAFIRDNANQTVLETEGTVFEWTQSGLLVFCNYKGNSHTLSIWNGKNIVDIAHGDSVFAEWTNSNGKSIWCTYG